MFSNPFEFKSGWMEMRKVSAEQQMPCVRHIFWVITPCTEYKRKRKSNASWARKKILRKEWKIEKERKGTLNTDSDGDGESTVCGSVLWLSLFSCSQHQPTYIHNTSPNYAKWILFVSFLFIQPIGHPLYTYTWMRSYTQRKCTSTCAVCRALYGLYAFHLSNILFKFILS